MPSGRCRSDRPPGLTGGPVQDEGSVGGLDKHVFVSYNYSMAQEIGTDPARKLLQGLRGLVRRFSVAERADVACCGVTVAQAATLETLLREGPLRLGTLGRRLGVTPSTLSRNVERLEAASLVRRATDPEDARSSRVSITPRGQAAARELERQELAFARQVLARVPEERREAVSTAFHDLLVAVRKATEACCPGAYEHLMEGLPARGEGRNAACGCAGRSDRAPGE
jgi:DNA-binding MarR family transcriptional regulator